MTKWILAASTWQGWFSEFDRVAYFIYILVSIYEGLSRSFEPRVLFIGIHWILDFNSLKGRFKVSYLGYFHYTPFGHHPNWNWTRIPPNREKSLLFIKSCTLTHTTVSWLVVHVFPMLKDNMAKHNMKTAKKFDSQPRHQRR